MFSPFEDFSPAARARLDAFLDQTYRGFKERVAAGRHMSADQVEAVAKGRVWSGEEAQGTRVWWTRSAATTSRCGLPRKQRQSRPTAAFELAVFPRPKSAFERIVDRIAGRDGEPDAPSSVQLIAARLAALSARLETALGGTGVLQMPAAVGEIRSSRDAVPRLTPASASGRSRRSSGARRQLRSACHIIAEALEITGLPRSASSISSTGSVGMPVPVRNTASALSSIDAARQAVGALGGLVVDVGHPRQVLRAHDREPVRFEMGAALRRRLGRIGRAIGDPPDAEPFERGGDRPEGGDDRHPQAAPRRASNAASRSRPR